MELDVKDENQREFGEKGCCQTTVEKGGNGTSQARQKAILPERGYFLIYLIPQK
jgi:hypothetical protein